MIFVLYYMELHNAITFSLLFLSRIMASHLHLQQGYTVQQAVLAFNRSSLNKYQEVCCCEKSENYKLQH